MLFFCPNNFLAEKSKKPRINLDLGLLLKYKNSSFKRNLKSFIPS
jgi:hypothetical protein